MADDALVTRAKQGDPDAWRELYRAHAGRLVAWLQMRPTGDAMASPEDVASEAWYVAASKVADFDGSTEDFGGWLFGIARRISATSRRTAQRRNTRPDDVSDLVGTVPDHGSHVAHQDWVRTMLATLSPRERAAVGLVDGLGMDAQAAAQVLGVSPVALRVARHRGLRRLARASASPTPVGQVSGPAPGV